MTPDHRATPAVQVDLDIAERNIRRGVAALAAHGIAHRPHIKAHKCAELARRQLELGCRGVTCAKLGEAEVMADAGIGDILIGFPIIGGDKLARYRRLAERVPRLCSFVNSLEGAEALSALGERMGRRLPVLLEMDGGIARGGVIPGDMLSAFALAVHRLPGLEIEGLACYGGDIYGCEDLEAVRRRARRERDELLENARRLEALGLNMQIVSAGSSFSILCPEELAGLTEVRAGNYIFNDCALLSVGLVEEADCALRVLATVVSRPAPDTAILDAGSKTLTTDTVNHRPGYGWVVGWPDAVLHKLNEEHGFVRRDSGLDWRVGDVVSVIPNHACTVPNLCDEMYGMRGGSLARVLRVDARGKNR